jgi:hypothetical protein
MMMGRIMREVPTFWRNEGSSLGLTAPQPLANEQCGTNTIKENICSENIQTAATAPPQNSPQKKT